MIDYISKFKLNKKVAVVNGGLGLLGNQISIALAQAGARVLIFDINKDQWKSFEKEIGKSKLDICFKKFDTSYNKETQKELKNIYKEAGPIHI